jgi:hypothetical protein
MKKIHLDTDLGGDIDDVCALSMLLRWSDIEITGITVVGDLTLDNAKRPGETSKPVPETADSNQGMSGTASFRKTGVQCAGSVPDNAAP